MLWSLAYDEVLRGDRPRGCETVGYADDTIVLATGRSWEDATRRAEKCATVVLTDVGKLGLKANAEKTTATWLGVGARERPPPEAKWVMVRGVWVEIARHMRYLGVELDERGRFLHHFGQLAPKLERTAAALGRLLPNTRGPSESARKLYGNMVRSMALYGAPMWAERACESRRIKDWLSGVERKVNLRYIQVYRTVSAVAAGVLAGSSPLDVTARERKRAYDQRVRDKNRGTTPSASRAKRRQTRLRNATIREWAARIRENARARENRTMQACLSILKRWVTRKHGAPSYRTTQLLTGHGYFGDFLKRIGQEPTAECHHYGA